MDFLYLLSLIAAVPFILYRGLKRGRWPHHTAQKLARRDVPTGPFDVLIHCVSVGETEAAVPVINMLLAEGKRVLVSVSTATGYEVAKKRFGEQSVAFYPYDFSIAVNRFLDIVSPKVVALVELEIWPNFVRSCTARGIEIVVINGRMTEKSLTGYRKISWLLKNSWHSIATFGVQDELQRTRFSSAGAQTEKIVVCGSVKFDREPPAGHADSRRELNVPENCLLTLAGSTHAGEEELVLSAWLRLRENNADARLLLAPRHLERNPAVARILDESGFKWAYKSSKTDAEIILLDTMGELARLYGAADIVIMGGTLLPGVGGHNPVEPALLGKPVIIGKYVDNFVDIVERLAEDDALVRTSDPEGLTSVFLQLAGDPVFRSEIGKRAENSVKKHRGASRKYCDILLGYTLQSNAPRI